MWLILYDLRQLTGTASYARLADGGNRILTTREKSSLI